MAAALAIILAIFAAIAAPDGSRAPRTASTRRRCPRTCSALLTLILVPVQVMLIVVAMIGFNQEWHVEEERPIGGQPLHGEGDDAGTAPAPA